MRDKRRFRPFLAGFAALGLALFAESAAQAQPKVSAVSTGTGLLLEPALTLPEFTRERFETAMATVGPEKIHKQWTSPVVTLPDRKSVV